MIQARFLDMLPQNKGGISMAIQEEKDVQVERDILELLEALKKKKD